MQYETLRAQLDPHFLFNTLNTIKWSAMASNAGNIADMIACLGRLLESAMRRGEEDIPLFRELEMVESYMQIKNWTLKYRYELKVQVPECFFNYPVFKYCLQPIVENAIVHGMEGMENGVVTIRARRENGFLLLEVHNNGKEMSPEQISQVLLQVRSASDSKRTLTGVGLSSIDGMVKLRYGKEYGILIDSGPGRGTTVTVSLPYRETDERRENRNAGDDKGPDCR
jgi:sensor histidine kinase YesM